MANKDGRMNDRNTYIVIVTRNDERCLPKRKKKEKENKDQNL